MNSPANSGNFASTDLPDFRQLPVFRQSTNVVCMPSSFDVLYGRERLRVGQLFLRSRPLIATAGGLANAAVLAASSAPFAQKRAIACALGGTILAFHWEAWSLKRRELTERWLLVSLAATLLALTGGALLSGGATSPFLPLFFAPVVVGYAAFARRAPSFLLFGLALVCLGLLLAAPLGTFHALPSSTVPGMLLVSSATSLALLALGVTGLADGYERLARSLDRLRSDALQEAQRRAQNVEHLGAEVAHEVKNPLTAARGLVQLVERRATDPRDVQRLRVVVTEIDRALTVLSDYLSFARPLSDLQLGAVEIPSLLADIRLMLEARAHEKSVLVHVAADSFQLVADRQRLRDAVLNLMVNALTAAPVGGTVHLRASHGPEHALFTITDDGPGMTAEQLERLGQPFASATMGGTGLGVMLADSVARLHGGKLHFDSAPGRGTRAILELPLESRAEAT